MGSLKKEMLPKALSPPVRDEMSSRPGDISGATAGRVAAGGGARGRGRGTETTTIFPTFKIVQHSKGPTPASAGATVRILASVNCDVAQPWASTDVG